MAGSGSGWWRGATLYQVMSVLPGHQRGRLRRSARRHVALGLPELARNGRVCSRRQCRRRTTTGATTSPTTSVSIPSWALSPTWTSWWPKPAGGACGFCSTSSRTTRAAPHPWFVEAVSDPGSEHRRFYVWADPAPDGGASQQLARRHERARLDARREEWAVLPAQLPAEPARPQLVGAGGTRGLPPDPAVLVRPGSGRFPHRCRPGPLQGRRATRRPSRNETGPAAQPFRPGTAEQRQPARVPRRLPRVAPDRRVLSVAPVASRRDVGRRSRRHGTIHGQGDELQLTFNIPSCSPHSRRRR